MTAPSTADRLNARPRAAAPTCPWCKDALHAPPEGEGEGEIATRTCRSCGTETHEECLRLHGGCPVHGCGAKPQELSRDHEAGACRRCHASLEHTLSDVICASCLGELWDRSHPNAGRSRISRPSSRRSFPIMAVALGLTLIGFSAAVPEAWLSGLDNLVAALAFLTVSAAVLWISLSPAFGATRRDASPRDAP